MKLKSKLLAGTSTLVMAGSMMAAAAPAAHAVVTSAGSCGGSVLLLKIAATAYPGGPVIAKGTGLGDQTAPVKVTGNLAKDQTLKTVIGGSCTGVHSRPLDTHIPGGSPATLTLHPTSQAVSLFGNSSCANTPADVAVDANATKASPLTGKITWTMLETYNDIVNGHSKKYTMQAAISALGFNPGGADELDVTGLVLTGVNVGDNVGGTVWFDPVLLDHGSSGYNTGYDLDISGAVGCVDGVANTANIPIVLSGGGTTSSTSILGTTGVPGISFQSGE